VRNFAEIIRLACLVEANRHRNIGRDPDYVVKAASQFEEFVTGCDKRKGDPRADCAGEDVAADDREHTTFHNVSEEAQSFADTCEYVTRMTVEIAEIAELAERMAALDAFRSSQRFHRLGVNDRALLDDQYKHMKAYHDILALRLFFECRVLACTWTMRLSAPTI
jgi:hypothetical protein